MKSTSKNEKEKFSIKLEREKRSQKKFSTKSNKIKKSTLGRWFFLGKKNKGTYTNNFYFPQTVPYQSLCGFHIQGR